MKNFMNDFTEDEKFLILSTKQKIIIAGLIVLLGGALLSTKLFSHKPAPASKGLPSVSLAKVALAKDVLTISAIGSVKAAQGVEVSAPTAGIIDTILFQSGQNVQAGDVLATLKNDDLKAIVMEDQSKYQIAQLDAARAKKLVKQGFISRQYTDQSLANATQAEAQLKHDQALLDNTIIKAPFSGALSISQVDHGQYVSAGQHIVSLEDRSKMYVDFSIPEKQSDQVAVGNLIVAKSHQSHNHEWQGKIMALGSQMDNDTRSLPVRVELTPPLDSLTPGMYVNISVLLPNVSNKPAVPQSAIVYNPYSDFVYLYHNGVVSQQYVDVGQKIGSNIIIEKGLNPGDQVVIAGQQKLFNGAKVEVIDN